MTNKAELKALEKVYGAEVEGRLPYQSKAAIYKSLTRQGLLHALEARIPSGIPGLLLTIDGYELTHAGRMTYCMLCTDDHSPPLEGEAER